MIIFDGVTKVVGAGNRKRDVLSSVRARLPSDRRIAVVGSGEEKRTFINLLAGLALPNAGRIIRQSRLSFPVGHLGGFTRDLSMKLNVAHVARLYGADVDEVVNFASQISALRDDFNKPFGDLSNPRRRYFSEILAFIIPFDVYLLSDDIVLPSGKRFNQEARALFEARVRTSGMIIASEDPEFAREFCDMGLVLAGGEMRFFQDLDQAFAFAGETENSRRRGGRRRRREAAAMQERGIAATSGQREGRGKRSKEERAAARQRRLARKDREQ